MYGITPSPETIEISEAIEIMDANLTEEEKKDGITNFLGPDEIKRTTFGPESVPSEIPPIPFSKEELLQAAKLGQFLILRSDQISKDKLQLPNVKRALEKAPEKRWALVTKEIIPDSTDKNYLEQIEQLIKYLREEVFADIEIPTEYEEAIAEFENKKEELRPKVTSQDEAVWKPVVEELINLDIVKMTRRSLDEVCYDLELYKQATGQYLLPNIYDWTRTRASDGNLVNVGNFDSAGVYGSRRRPGSSYSFLGAFFSRSI